MKKFHRDLETCFMSHPVHPEKNQVYSGDVAAVLHASPNPSAIYE